MSNENQSDQVSDGKDGQSDASLPAVDPLSGHETENEESGELGRSDWIHVVKYFLGVLFFIGLFVYMIASGPKGALIGGISLLAGALLWVVFRYVLKEID